MKLYRAETGCSVQWENNSLKDIETMEQLYQTIEQYTHIAPENQILITSYGNIVKTDNVQQVLQATGKDEYLVFCYNREWLSKKPAQMSDLLAKEFPKLQPEIVSFNGLGHLKQIGQQLNKKTVDENCEAYATLFKNLYSYSGSLMEGIQTHAKIASDTVEEQKMQTMALNVALENLNSHIGSGTRKVQAYLEVAKKELARQNGLLKSLNNDINILRHTSIHKAILDKLDNGDERLKLLDFVDLDRIGSIHTESKQLYNNLKKKSHELAKVTRELANHQKDLLDHVGKSSNLQSLDATLSDVKSIAKTAQECSDDISKSIPKVEDTINKLTSDSVSIAFSNMSLNTRRNSASSSPVSFSMAKKKFDSLNHLAIYQFDDPIYKLVKYDTIMRQNVSNLIKSKYSSISEFFLNMSIVSGIQDCIVEMEHDTAEELDRLNLFKKKYGKNDLESVRQVAFAYGALLIELVRRREYKNIIVKNSNLLADLLSDYRSVEEKRREQFKRIVSKSLPFRFADLDKPSPQSEVNLNLVKDHNETTLEKGDITEFISLLNTVYVQPVSVSPSKKPSFATVTSPKRSIHSNRIEENPILVFLNAMFTQMNDLKSDFLKTLESNFFTLQKIDPAVMQQLIEADDHQDKDYDSPSKPTSASSSSDSSTFSVVEDDKAKFLKQDQEIEELKQALAKAENEKEDLENQVQKLDQINQTLEQNRRSFINELKNKDKSIDFRIASVEEDFQNKISDLQFALEEEKRMKKNLEIEHASEMNSIRCEHKLQIDQLKAQLLKEKQGQTNAVNEKIEIQQRNENLQEVVASLKSNIESERSTHEEELMKKQSEKDALETVIAEIKLVQEKTKAMVNRTQEDWFTKSEELQEVKMELETLEKAVWNLLERFIYPKTNVNYDCDLESCILLFKEKLEEWTKQFEGLKNKHKDLNDEVTAFSATYKNMTDEHEEWRSIGSHMAEKLEEYRKNVIYELVLKLQLPMDEAEIYTLSRNLTPSDDDAAIWNQVLQLSSAVSNQKVVTRIMEKSKSQYDMIEQSKAQYKTLKDKYRRLFHNSSEKISFRNFKVGDVALFLPTRNSTGKPWAAFNINAPHYFLNFDDTTQPSKEWIVARIVSMTEHTVDENNPESNPYALAHGLRYYNLQVESWRANRPSQHKNKKRTIEPDSGLASLASSTPMIPTSPPQKRPSFSAAASSNNIVHSYVNK